MLCTPSGACQKRKRRKQPQTRCHYYQSDNFICSCKVCLSFLLRLALGKTRTSNCYQVHYTYKITAWSLTQTNCTHDTRLDDFHLKVILGWCERFSSNVHANAAVFLPIVTVHNKCIPSVKGKGDAVLLCVVPMVMSAIALPLGVDHTKISAEMPELQLIAYSLLNCAENMTKLFARK